VATGGQARGVSWIVTLALLVALAEMACDVPSPTPSPTPALSPAARPSPPVSPSGLPTPTPAPPPGPVASPVPTPVCPPCGRLQVEVRELVLPGTLPATPELTPAPTSTPHPFTQVPVVVRVTPAWDRARVVAEGMTDARGMAQFDLPPADYWAFVPLDTSPRLMDDEPAGRLPDGTTVYGWREVIVRARDSLDLTLTLVYPAP
jgi:hypothetical protein